MSLGISSNRYPYSIATSTKLYFGKLSPAEIQAAAKNFRNALETIQNEHHQILIEVNGEKVEKKTQRFLQKREENPNRSHMMGIIGPTGSGKGTVFSLLSDFFTQNKIFFSKPLLTEEGKQALRDKDFAEFKDKPAQNNKIQTFEDKLTVTSDSFFKDNSQRRAELGDAKFFRETNLDVLPAYQLLLLTDVINQLKKGYREVKLPLYSFHDSSSTPNGISVQPGTFTFVEGIILFAKERLAKAKEALHHISLHSFEAPFNLRKKFDLTMSIIVSDEAKHRKRWEDRWRKERNGEPSQENWEKAWEGYNALVKPFEKKAMLRLDNIGSADALKTVVEKIGTAMQKYLDTPKAESAS